MKKIVIILLFILLLIIPTSVLANENETIIVEVEDDLDKFIDHIETYHPFIEVKHTYEVIFNGLALEGKPRQLFQLEELEQVKAVHQIHDYETSPHSKNKTKAPPSDLTPPNIPYTGKGVKVGVIDTGVDYTHPDIKTNYQAGYDVFDMDDDPMETLPHEGMPTEHGTHVAGIIAANGELKGVAPDAEIFAYRALGPGGFGTTVHILAALEQAVKDEVDIINLSLGNPVNGPDYPTSIAVNKAAELGIAVVIANGNSGPDKWTVGAPATAQDALAVGAAQGKTMQAMLQNPLERKAIPLEQIHGTPTWDIERDYRLAYMGETVNLHNKIAIVPRGEEAFYMLVQEAQEKGAVGVILINDEKEPMTGALEMDEEKIHIPVAVVTKEDGEWLIEQEDTYMKTVMEEVDEQIADFSSRGPVTVNWQIKPDLLAPGTEIQSTVPGGYAAFSGTSMAAPYVSGVLAIMKEAHPDWEVDKMFNVLKTEAIPFKKEDQPAPTSQGHGLIQPEASLDPTAILSESSLHYGKMTAKINRKTIQLQIENRTKEKQRYSFDIPRNKNMFRFHLPLSFTLGPNETKTVDIKLEINQNKLEEGLYEDYLTLTEQNSEREYQLPYLFVHEGADQPKTFGFELTVNPLAMEDYHYQIYASENLRSFTVDLYDPDTLTWRGELFRIDEVSTGVNEGEFPRSRFEPGIYAAQVTAITEDGEVEAYEMDLHLE